MGEKKPRSAALNVDYKVFLGTNADGDRAFEKYCDNMRALKEQNGYKEQTGILWVAATREKAEVWTQISISASNRV